MAKKETSNNNGHTHLYTEQVTDPNRASYTMKTNGHRHRIERDGSGKAIRFAREKGSTAPLHTHRIV